MLWVRIRKIVKDDDLQIESVIRSVFHELNIPLIGTAYEDPKHPVCMKPTQCLDQFTLLPNIMEK